VAYQQEKRRSWRSTLNTIIRTAAEEQSEFGMAADDDEQLRKALAAHAPTRGRNTMEAPPAVDEDLQCALAASRADSAPAPPPPAPRVDEDADLRRALAASRVDSQPRYHAPRSQEEDDAALARRLAAEFDSEPAAPPPSSYAAPSSSYASSPAAPPPSYGSDDVWNAPSSSAPPPRSESARIRDEILRLEAERTAMQPPPPPSYGTDAVWDKPQPNEDADLQRALAASRADVAPRPQGLFASLSASPAQRTYDALPPPRPAPASSGAADYLRRAATIEYAPPPQRQNYGNSAESYLRSAAEAPPPAPNYGHGQQRQQDPDLPPPPAFGRPDLYRRPPSGPGGSGGGAGW